MAPLLGLLTMMTLPVLLATKGNCVAKQATKQASGPGGLRLAIVLFMSAI